MEPASTFAADYSIAPASGWVADIGIEDPGSHPEKSIKNGTYYLLVDTQEKPKAEANETFRRFVEKVVTHKGISAVSQISINFNPSYQDLVVHRINIHRSGRTIDKLQYANISILQREKELEAQLYDGTKTFNVILDDIQVNDILEYSYTLRGINPVFDGRYFKAINVQWRVPVYRLHHRLVWPKDKTLYIKQHMARIDPVIQSTGAFTEYIFADDRIPALIPDSDLPDWYAPYPWIQFSEVNSWREVIDWGKRLYQIPQDISPELKDKIEEIMTGTKRSEDRLIAALRFIQDEIRYMGIEIGAGSHKPYKPSHVFQRRFGDCKDKTFLLMTMLHHMGISSYPSLVNTKYLSQVEKWLPTPLAFNHVLLKVDINRRAYWVDPTRTYQRGSIDNLYQPNYGSALVLNGHHKHLTPMTPGGNYFPTKEITERFDLRNGYHHPTVFTVDTVYRGKMADYYRGKFATESKKELEKAYLNHHASEYADIESNAALNIEDNSKDNTFSVKESYVIPEFWQRSKDKTFLEGKFYPLDLYDLIGKPKTKQRSMPLKVKHPTHYVHATEILLPEDWEVNSSVAHIEDDAIFFENRVEYENRHITIRYEYRTKKNHLSPDKVPEHLKTLEKINHELGYLITKQDIPWRANTNWPMAIVAFLLFILAFFSTVKTYHYQPPYHWKLLSVESDYRRIGGWLYFAEFCILVQPIFLAWKLVSSHDVFSLSFWNSLTRPGSESYHFLWQPVLIYELSTYIFWFLFSVLMVILFFQRRRSFPGVYIAYLVITLALLMIDTIAALSIPSTAEQWGFTDTGGVVRYALFTVGWSLYFIKSRRVKHTFVEIPEDRRRTNTYELAGSIGRTTVR